MHCVLSVRLSAQCCIATAAYYLAASWLNKTP